MATNEITPVLLGQQTTAESERLDKKPGLGGVRSEQSADSAQKLPVRQEEKEQALPREEIEQVAEFLSESANLFNVGLKFNINEDTDRVIVSVVNKDTEEVIRQIPPEEVVDLAKRLNEMAGVLFNQTA
jgi:flagellar protein FlaG